MVIYFIKQFYGFIFLNVMKISSQSLSFSCLTVVHFYPEANMIVNFL